MENTHKSVEFGMLQKTSKQSLIFFCIGMGDTPSHTPPPPPGTPLDTTVSLLLYPLATMQRPHCGEIQPAYAKHGGP